MRELGREEHLSRSRTEKHTQSDGNVSMKTVIIERAQIHTADRPRMSQFLCNLAHCCMGRHKSTQFASFVRQPASFLIASSFALARHLLNPTQQTARVVHISQEKTTEIHSAKSERSLQQKFNGGRLIRNIIIVITTVMLIRHFLNSLEKERSYSSLLLPPSS